MTGRFLMFAALLALAVVACDESDTSKSPGADSTSTIRTNDCTSVSQSLLAPTVEPVPGSPVLANVDFAITDPTSGFDLVLPSGELEVRVRHPERTECVSGIDQISGSVLTGPMDTSFIPGEYIYVVVDVGRVLPSNGPSPSTVKAGSVEAGGHIVRAYMSRRCGEVVRTRSGNPVIAVTTRQKPTDPVPPMPRRTQPMAWVAYPRDGGLYRGKDNGPTRDLLLDIATWNTTGTEKIEGSLVSDSHTVPISGTIESLPFVMKNLTPGQYTLRLRLVGADSEALSDTRIQEEVRFRVD